MLKKIIDEQAARFGVMRIGARRLIDKVAMTAFSWTNSPGALCLAMNKKYFVQAAENPSVVCIIAPPAAIAGTPADTCVIEAEKAADLFYFLHNLAIHTDPQTEGERNKGFISASAKIDETVILGENVRIGEAVTIEAGCIILDHTVIEDGVAIGPRCTIGVDGFFSKTILGEKVHIHHFGGVHIGSGCKLHSDITIARSANYDEFTRIGKAVHIGHKSIVGHDCTIGDQSDISVNVVIAGRTRIGNSCWVGACACISNACRIGDQAKIRIGAVVISDVEAKAEYSGNFAIAHRKNLMRYLKER